MSERLIEAIKLAKKWAIEGRLVLGASGERRKFAPTLIQCKTIIGKGAPKRAGTSKAHGEPLGAEEIAGARAAMGWNYPPFEIPAGNLFGLGCKGYGRCCRVTLEGVAGAL